MNIFRYKYSELKRQTHIHTFIHSFIPHQMQCIKNVSCWLSFSCHNVCCTHTLSSSYFSSSLSSLSLSLIRNKANPIDWSIANLRLLFFSVRCICLLFMIAISPLFRSHFTFVAHFHILFANYGHIRNVSLDCIFVQRTHRVLRVCRICRALDPGTNLTMNKTEQKNTQKKNKLTQCAARRRSMETSECACIVWK